MKMDDSVDIETRKIFLSDVRPAIKANLCKVTKVAGYGVEIFNRGLINISRKMGSLQDY